MLFKQKMHFLLIINALIAINTIKPNYNNLLKNKINQISHDLTIVGYPVFADGIGRLPIGFIDMLKNDLNINFINSRPSPPVLIDIPLSVKKIIQNSDKKVSKIVLFVDLLWTTTLKPDFDYFLRGKIKIAYSMLESSAIPPTWTSILNQDFDAVIVPDTFVQQVYENSGVKIPIFVLPFNLYLEKFLEKPKKTKLYFGKNKPFTFGTSCVFDQRKEHALLLDSFVQEFGNSKEICLKIHGRPGDKKVIQNLRSKIKKYKFRNIKLIENRLTETDYIEFINSLDCYVFLSKGEGFSVTPREAMALGIPCILTNNSAHKTICDTGLARPVKCTIKGKAYYEILGGFIGTNLGTTISEVRTALRDVYNNYDYWLNQCGPSREWVKQYLAAELKPYYLSLVKPKKIFLGKNNVIKRDCIITTSKKLYNKYLNK